MSNDDLFGDVDHFVLVVVNSKEEIALIINEAKDERNFGYGVMNLMVITLVINVGIKMGEELKFHGENYYAKIEIN